MNKTPIATFDDLQLPVDVFCEWVHGIHFKAGPSGRHEDCESTQPAGSFHYQKLQD